LCASLVPRRCLYLCRYDEKRYETILWPLVVLERKSESSWVSVEPRRHSSHVPVPKRSTVETEAHCVLFRALYDLFNSICFCAYTTDIYDTAHSHIQTHTRKSNPCEYLLRLS
jgi:hypothetical protein